MVVFGGQGIEEEGEVPFRALFNSLCFCSFPSLVLRLFYVSLCLHSLGPYRESW
jgi:hypothetical protein